MEEIRIEVECEDANSFVPCEGEVDLRLCPYDEDVNGIQTPVWLCDRHDYERTRDI